MVQREAGHRDIETSGLIEIFDPRLTEDRTLRRSRIDRDDVIPAAFQGTREPAVPTSDFEDPRRRTWEYGLNPRVSGHPGGWLFRCRPSRHRVRAEPQRR